MDTPSEDETRRLAETVTTLVRLSSRSNREIDQELGFGSGFLDKARRGEVRLEPHHLARICEVLRVEPEDLALLTFPEAKKPPSLFVSEIRAKLRLEPEEKDAPSLEESVQRILRKLLEEKS